MTGRVAHDRLSEPGEERRPLVAPRDDSPLSLDVLRLHAGTPHRLSDGHEDRDLLLFAFEGSATLTVAGGSHELTPDSAALVLAGEDASLEAGTAGLAAICAVVGPEAERHAPLGQRETVVRQGATTSAAATGARSFEILLGPHNGCTRATLFVGHVPPGRAPWHYHLYDELVWIPEGPGRLHLQEGVEELGPGAAFRLRSREVHVVENASADEMALVGIFTPAGSPSAAYLTADVAAEYRFAG